MRKRLRVYDAGLMLAYISIIGLTMIDLRLDRRVSELEKGKSQLQSPQSPQKSESTIQSSEADGVYQLKPLAWTLLGSTSQIFPAIPFERSQPRETVFQRREFEEIGSSYFQSPFELGLGRASQFPLTVKIEDKSNE
jgi:hypothetical protein